MSLMHPVCGRSPVMVLVEFWPSTTCTALAFCAARQIRWAGRGGVGRGRQLALKRRQGMNGRADYGGRRTA